MVEESMDDITSLPSRQHGGQAGDAQLQPPAHPWTRVTSRKSGGRQTVSQPLPSQRLAAAPTTSAASVDRSAAKKSRPSDNEMALLERLRAMSPTQRERAMAHATLASEQHAQQQDGATAQETLTSQVVE